MIQIPISKPNIIYKPELVDVIIPIEEKKNPNYLISIVKDKTQTNVWRYHSIVNRILYTRLKLTFIPGVLPKIN